MNEKTGRKVLVIDDEKAAYTQISECLGTKGFEVTVVTDPQTAVQRAKELEPELIFSSLLLPGTNGLKVSKMIHAIEKLSRIPVVMMISYAGELDPKYTVTIGIVDVLVKPLKKQEILEKTFNILEGTVSQPSSPEQKTAEEDFEVLSIEEETEEKELSEVKTAALDESDIFEIEEETEDLPDFLKEDKGKSKPASDEASKHDLWADDFLDKDEDRVTEAKKPDIRTEHKEDEDEDDDDIKQMLREEETTKQETEEPGYKDEPAYKDEYDSFEKKSNKKIAIIAVSILIIVVLGAGAFMMKDRLFPSRAEKIASLPQKETPSVEQKVITEPAPQKPQTEVQPAKQEAAPAVTAVSKPAVTEVSKKETPPAPPLPSVAEEKKKESAKKEPVKAAPAEKPEKQAPVQKKPSEKKEAKPLKEVKAPVEQVKKGYSVQIGVFENRKNAEAFADKFKQKGYDASIKTDEGSGKKTLYRVLIGRFDDRKKALLESVAISQKEGVKSIIHQH